MYLGRLQQVIIVKKKREENFVCEGQAGGTHWTGIREQKQLSFIEDKTPEELKVRWSKEL